MAVYTVQDEQTGKKVKFEWEGNTEPTEHDMARVFAEARGVPQERIGTVAERFEAPSPKTISTGSGDYGGKSYGRFQLASRGPRTLDDFLNRSGYRNRFRAVPGTPSFDREWQQVAGEPQFEQAQYDYIYEKNYLPVANNLLRNHGIDLAESRPLQELVFSTANQYGPSGGYKVIRQALERIPKSDVTEKELIDAITDWKVANTSRNFRSSSSAVANNQKSRFERERQVYYDMLGQAKEPEQPTSPDNPSLEEIERVAAQERQEQEAQGELVHTMPDGSTMAGPEHPGAIPGSERYLPEVEPAVASTSRVDLGEAVSTKTRGPRQEELTAGIPTRQPTEEEEAKAAQLLAKQRIEENAPEFAKSKAGALAEGVAHALTLGMFDSAEKQTAQGAEPAAFTAGEIGVTIAQALTGGSAVARGVAKIPALAKSPIVASAITRAATSGGLTATKNAADVARGRKEFREAFWDSIQAAGAGAISMVPEVIAPANAWQLIAQPAADLIYDAAIDAIRGKKVKSKEWLQQELINLAMAEGFAIRDVKSGARFKAEQAAQRKELKGWLRGKGENGFTLERVAAEQAKDASDPRLFAPGAEDRVQTMVEGTNRMGQVRDAGQQAPREPVVSAEPDEIVFNRRVPEPRKPTVEEQVAKMAGYATYEKVPDDLKAMLIAPAERVIADMEAPKAPPKGTEIVEAERPKATAEQLQAADERARLERPQVVTWDLETGEIIGVHPRSEDARPHNNMTDKLVGDEKEGVQHGRYGMVAIMDDGEWVVPTRDDYYGKVKAKVEDMMPPEEIWVNKPVPGLKPNRPIPETPETKVLTDTPESGRLEGEEPTDEPTQSQQRPTELSGAQGEAASGRLDTEEPEGGGPEDWDDIGVAESAEAAQAEVRGFFDEADLEPWNTPEAQPTAERPHTVFDYDPSVEESTRLEAELFRHKQFHFLKKKIRNLFEQRGLPPGSKRLKEAVDREMSILRGEAGTGRFGENQQTDPEVDKMLTRIAEGLNGEEGTEAIAPVAKELDVTPGKIHPDDVRAWMADATISPIDVSRMRGQIKASAAEREQALRQQGKEAEARFSDQPGDLFGRTEGQQRVAQEQTRLAEEHKAKQRANPLEGTMFDAEEMEARGTEQGDLFAAASDSDAEYKSIDDAIESVTKSVDEDLQAERQKTQRGSIAYGRRKPGSAPEPGESAIPEGVNQEAHQRMMQARGKPRESWARRAAARLTRIKQAMTRERPELDPVKDAPMLEKAREYDASRHEVDLTVGSIMRGTTSGLEGDEIVLFERVIELQDMVRSIETKPALYEGKDELWYGYKSADEIKSDLEKYRTAAGQNPRVSKALKKRASLQRTLTKQLVDKGILSKQVVTNEDGEVDYSLAEQYYHRQVIDYLDATGKIGKASPSSPTRKGKKSFQKKRVEGATKDFNTLYAEAEREYLADAMQSLKDKEMVDWVDKEYGVGQKVDQDYTEALEKEYQRLGGNLEELQAEANDLKVPKPAYKFFVRNRIADMAPDALKKAGLENRDRFIPDGYEEVSVGDMRVYKGFSLPENVIDQVIAGKTELSKDMFQEVMVMGGKGQTIIVPENIATTMKTLVKAQPDDFFSKGARRAIGAWKWTKLYAPTRFPKYYINNWFGDADATFAAYPGIFKEYEKAVSDLWDIHQGKGVSKEIIDLVGKGVIGSGYASQEIPDISSREFFGSMLGKKNVIDRMLRHPVQTYIDFVHNINSHREDCLRLAAYRWTKQQIDQGRVLYGASNRKAIDQLRESKNISNDQIAAKISREILGDYGAITEAGDYMRRHVAPFWSWCEINTRRYYRLMMNAPFEGNTMNAAKALGSATARGAAKAGVGTAKLGAKVALASSFLMTVEMWNRLVANRIWPGVYDEMDEETRQMRIILGRTEEGEIRTIRAQGAFSDVLGWVGLENASNEIEALVRGEKSLKDLGENAVNEFTNKTIGMIAPQFKFLGELATKKVLYPDIFKPRNMRNRWEYVAKQLEVDPVYRWMAKIPSRGLEHELMSAVIYKQDAGESAYFQTFRLVDEFKEKIGKSAFQGYTPTKKSNAMYYYKKALRFDDKRAARHWLKEYVRLSKKENPDERLTIKMVVDRIQKSIHAAAPLSSISNENRTAFLRSLDKKDKKTVARAIKWYQSIYNAGESNSGGGK